MLVGGGLEAYIATLKLLYIYVNLKKNETSRSEPPSLALFISCVGVDLNNEIKLFKMSIFKQIAILEKNGIKSPSYTLGLIRCCF